MLNQFLSMNTLEALATGRKLAVIANQWLLTTLFQQYRILTQPDLAHPLDRQPDIVGTVDKIT
jgi:hypothetical protein